MKKNDQIQQKKVKYLHTTPFKQKNYEPPKSRASTLRPPSWQSPDRD
jgi:hypothetical protein